MKNNLAVYLADDHIVALKGMSRLFKTFYRVGSVKEATNGKELLALCKLKEPDAVILDLEMPVMGGFETATYLIKNFPRVKILVLTMHTEETFIARLMNVGVHGYLSKTSEPEEVERALYSIIDTDFYPNKISLGVPYKIKDWTKNNNRELSIREVEVLLLICQELSPDEISDRLKISKKTFFNHRENIIRKVGAKSNIGLMRYALQTDLIKLAVDKQITA